MIIGTDSWSRTEHIKVVWGIYRLPITAGVTLGETVLTVGMSTIYLNINAFCNLIMCILLFSE